MSWSRTYTHTLAIAVDQLGAAVIFNRPDLTISTLCWVVMSGDAQPLKLALWQIWSLRCLGPILNRIQANHCAQAREGDMERAQSTLLLLSPAQPAPK